MGGESRSGRHRLQWEKKLHASELSQRSAQNRIKRKGGIGRNKGFRGEGFYRGGTEEGRLRRRRGAEDDGGQRRGSAGVGRSGDDRAAARSDRDTEPLQAISRRRGFGDS
ncbi:hypothetical protein GW17_00023757 [Ensete ventricosum]|nr:hypothetical protein GW17_00023757 [Ensete ventricosum]